MTNDNTTLPMLGPDDIPEDAAIEKQGFIVHDGDRIGILDYKAAAKQANLAQTLAETARNHDAPHPNMTGNEFPEDAEVIEPEDIPENAKALQSGWILGDDGVIGRLPEKFCGTTEVNL